MSFICVGCPVSNRRWAMDKWYESVLESCDRAKVKPHFVFVQSENDDSLDDVIFNDNATIINVDEPLYSHRNWQNSSRYFQMVDLRNTLLEKVREISPDLFLSLDSDIMIHYNFIKSCLSFDKNWDALGGKVYLSKSRKEYPSYAKISPQGTLIRPDVNGFFKTDVLMAIKLMKPSAYNVDYKYDKRGEDIGWSLNCKEKGLSLYWNGTLTSKHVFLPERIGDFDDRVGY